MIFDKRALNSHTALNLGAIFRQTISNLQAISNVWLLALANERERERERESKSPPTPHKTTFSTQNLNFKAQNAKFKQNSNFTPQNTKFTPQNSQNLLQVFEFRPNFKEIHANRTLQAFCLRAKALR